MLFMYLPFTAWLYPPFLCNIWYTVMCYNYMLSFVCVQGDKNKRETSGPNEIVSCTNCGPNPCTHTANNGCATEVCIKKSVNPSVTYEGCSDWIHSQCCLWIGPVRWVLFVWPSYEIKHLFFTQVFLQINCAL